MRKNQQYGHGLSYRQKSSSENNYKKFNMSNQSISVNKSMKITKETINLTH